MDPRSTGPAAFPGMGGDLFSRDRYLLNQKVLSLGSKYFVYGEGGEQLFYVDRPVFRLQAHVGIYTDETRSNKLLTVYQDCAWAFINQSFTLLDANDQPIAYMKRQGWLSMIRRTWKILDVNRSLLATAQEDSWWKAVARRVTDFGEFLRTNFIITGADGRPIGTYVRRYTLTDKYIMDLTPDTYRSFDRRIAVALAVLLDTAEGR